MSRLDAWLDSWPDWVVYLIVGSCLAALVIVPAAVAVYQ
jgi:hypothetical protein